MSADAPVIIESGIYTREQVVRLLRVSTATLTEWQKDGLQVCRRRTKRTFFHGRDLIEFLKG